MPGYTGYNWFLRDATSNLLLLLKIDDPTPEQREQAERVVMSTAGYTRSIGGH